MDIRQQLLLAFEAEHREHIDAIRAALAGEGGASGPDWNDVFRRAHSLKGASRAVDLPPVEAVAHRLETLFERVSTGQRPLDADARAAVDLALDRIEAFVADMKAGEAEMPADAHEALDACLTGSPRRPETKAAQALVSEREATPPDPGPDPARTFVRVPAASVQSVVGAAYGLGTHLTERNAVTEGLGRMEAEVGNLRRQIEIARVRHGSDPDRLQSELRAFEAAFAGLARLTTELVRAEKRFSVGLDAAAARVRDEAERLALVPAETVFGAFPRALRDMAREAGREVDVTATGLETPIERNMLQVLKDPVLHALRNALSHGGETPEMRSRAGKPAAMSIALNVAIHGARLVLAIHDDGRGPDLSSIERRGREQNLLGAGENATPERLLALVFEPGFSTADTLDTVAGRGMGLSVVAEAARKLDGDVRLQARTPHGASLVMSLPLAAARRSVLVVEAGGEDYALPSAAVERLINVDRSDIRYVAERPVATLLEGGHAVTLPIFDLAGMLGEKATETGSVLPVILVRSAGRRYLLAVERLRETHTVLVLPAPPLGVDPRVVVGTIILGERPVLMLDPENLPERAEAVPARPAAPGITARATPDGTMVPRRRSTILVVDDSITTRTLEKSILEAAGYRVVVCVDGQDAIEFLRAGSETVDLVLADVEMPRLDGFGLVEALRGDAVLGKLPVILMTSRGAADDVARGLKLGASAYLTKQKFDQRELLKTVGQLL